MFFKTKAANATAAVLEAMVIGAALVVRYGAGLDNSNGFATGISIAVGIWGTILNAGASTAVNACARRKSSTAYQALPQTDTADGAGNAGDVRVDLTAEQLADGVVSQADPVPAQIASATL